MKIKKLEKTNNHIRDNRIDFDELNHTYTIDKKFQAISVTQLVNKFFPEFDKEYWAEKESKKTGIKKEKILNKWRELGEKARNLGTELHSQIENYYNSLKYEKSREFEKFINFHDKYISDKYEPYRTEWRIFDEDKLLAGTVDMVYRKENDDLFIFDWKRSKKIINSNGTVERENPFENGLKGLSHLSSSDYIKYCLQQNIYKYIIEKNYEKKVSSMNLLILHPNYNTYHIVQVDEFSIETDYLINSL